ncbi:MAG TPA: J domain-containing protein [Aquabacterium sp.]|uniref:J domain-containing protein n=1 Tax=Aquabacterium sp. TaxID=1872578 RepID=UPI002E35B3BB|nr:J domain-containing protein [Aquabacterium sp.]HEX5357371.1 J domain-containing protein [Aquabacterium sp.]
MNHYERLKVSHDAPPEVIRAAYRALATKLHPDRQGAETGPDDVMHEQMAALNTAYEVLIDPKLRQDYDATLAPAHARVPVEDHHSIYAEPTTQAPNTRVDMDWLPPKPPKAQTFWPPSRQVMIVGGGAVALLALISAGAVWQMSGQQQMEKALSDQYARNADQRLAQTEAALPDAPAPAVAGRKAADTVAPSPAVTATAGRRRPTVAELSRMSDEELMRVLPTLDGDGAAPAATAQSARSIGKGSAHHPLDGKPLNLRVDNQLIDPLAPEPPPAKGKSRP